MTRSLALLLPSAAMLFAAAENTWDKVKELKSGTEIRIVRKGVAQPIEAKLDEVHDDSIAIVVKNAQRSIPKDEIVRLDARPKPGARVKETTVKDNPPDPTPPVGMNHGANVPGQSSSTNYTFNKPGYETIYRNPTHSMLNAK
jgi:hypothetical protein